ncbi:MAG: hypothetical protein QOK42_1568 [Frankiaceae bacterium]|nr:hypothetical protein [Frankiaceae bacterium]
MRLPLVPEELSREAVLERARSTMQVAGALATTARGAAPAVLKELPHLVGTVAGTAWGVGSALVRKAMPGEAFSPPMGEHQVADVEAQRDATLPPPAQARPEPEPVAQEAAEVGAPGAAAALVEKAALQVADADDFVSGATMTHDELPLPDFDHLTIGSLRNRIRPLDVVQLIQLREWERNHANRLPVITALENRIAKLQSDDADSGAPKLVPTSQS